MAPRYLTELLASGRDPDPALVTGASVLTYGELRAGVERLAGALSRLGVGGMATVHLGHFGSFHFSAITRRIFVTRRAQFASYR